MLCQECGVKPATLHFTKIVNGEKTEFHICESCAREKGELIPGTAGGFSIHSLLSGLLDLEGAGKEKSAATKTTQSLVCENCGMTYSQFSKMGRFGCSSCYKYFNSALDPLFKRVHGSTGHVGKIPKRAGAQIMARRQIDELKQELLQSITQEEFETAAQLRDQIRKLEKEIAQE
ncbi:protein-arginine kinase activator protein [Paenibacillus albidus]|uniref:Protein-arginine kinase activator protein n=1 Tax=Paenibacillus albidus TaxID=2041023 RepID=A0A917FSU2_9BACL|nr:UvrB/UvrC motif-containing protein [Paenibacillus albidus]MBT2293676.1 UvrB/UvrC motif-containing protein [Paenibacillus albidus]GGG05329.1 protein-arginine kinase activator protein [Paenibacillus albidus]